ncbi:hypothetical protein CCAN11_2210014 [Capnocytophaga canimorsus]|uniref:Uncharacterized protein n=1 Tax=Capnocytophaga canimorsus TaxID=28188 RepID=A0A0B7ILG8_9FLAO|nr:hypothetical protein CCAN11_2210014 [Capnocytophaga canimorsus]
MYFICKKHFSVAEFAKSVRFVSKEEAAEQFSQEIGEDFFIILLV